MNDEQNSEGQNWQQALQVIRQYEDLPLDEIKVKIRAAIDDPDVLKVAYRLLERLEHNDTYFDELSQNILDEVITENDFLVGKKIGTYHLVKLIAKGGMSNIYEAYNTNDNSRLKVALKVLSPYVYSNKSIELFKREQMILGKLNHPNIISIHQSGNTEDGIHYLVMELVKNAQTIDFYCETNRLSVLQIVELVIQISGIYAYAHKNLILHRDIKASNVLITEEQQIKIIDFGIGQIQSNKNQTLTHVFTPETASPEQLLGQYVGIQTDVFSLGALLLQLISKKKPLPKINLSNYDPRNDEKHVKELMKSLAIDTDLKNIIFCAMHIDVDQRYENMPSFRNDLMAWSKNLPVSATSDSKSYRFKKFLFRNPITSMLSLMLLLTSLISLVFIINFAQSAQEESARSAKVLNYLMQFFGHADPITAKDGNITLKEYIKNANASFSNEFKDDIETQIILYSKLAEINENLDLNEDALLQYESALKLIENEKGADPHTVFKLMNAKANVLNQLANIDDSIELSNEVLLAYENLRLNDESIKINALINLSNASRKVYGFGIYDAKTFNKITTQLESICTSRHDLNDALKIKVAHALGLAYLSQKNHVKAIQYLNHALGIVYDSESKDDALTIKLLLDLTAAHIRINKFYRAKAIIKEAIERIKSLDDSNIRLGWAYQLYAQIYHESGQYSESIEMIDLAFQIAQQNKNDHQIYYNYFLRSLYHNRINSFHLGLSDQISLFPFIAETSGIKTPRMAVNLMNLAMKLYILDEYELGEKAARLSIEIWYSIEKPAQTRTFLILAGNLAVTAGNRDLAGVYLKEAQALGAANHKSSVKILRHLLGLFKSSDEDTYSLSNQNIYPKIAALLQSNVDLSGKWFDAEELATVCRIDLHYRKMQIIGLRELYLEQCLFAYESQKLVVPTEIADEIQSIEKGKQHAQSKFNNEMRKVIIDILKHTEAKIDNV